jgi:hypothetical protein
MTRKGLNPNEVTPDGRYFVVRGRVWHLSNPLLEPEVRRQLTQELMAARRKIRTVKNDPELIFSSAAPAAVARN